MTTEKRLERLEGKLTEISSKLDRVVKSPKVYEEGTVLDVHELGEVSITGQLDTIIELLRMMAP